MDDLSLASPVSVGKASPAADVGTEDAALDRLAQQLVRVEANFLRLPLFALDTKNMRTMDGIRCEGTLRRADQSYAFTYAVTRNAATLYPGPLARSAHFALLSLATARGFPVASPLVFTWRELCAAMGIQASGKIVADLREALTATKGLMIESHSALFSKAENRPLSSEEHGQVIGLYDELEFYGADRHDGSRVEVNAVWFSRWYLDNLNAMYTGPLDFALWRRLNEHSPIASRLYEFLFFKFYSGVEFLRFNYATLVKFIPARTERYLSDAKKQLQPALSLLIMEGVLQGAQWVASRDGGPQLLLRRGSVLETVPREALAYEMDEEAFALKSVEHVSLPDEGIVQEFHRLWGHDNFTPQKGEREAARAFLDRFGEPHLRHLLPEVVKRMKHRWPDAKTFSAAKRYVEEVAGEMEQRRRAEDRRQQEDQLRERERAQTAEKAKEQAALKAAWTTLSADEQAAIQAEVLSGQPASLQKHPALVERLCLAALANRFAT
jgi:hypothetical protein